MDSGCSFHISPIKKWFSELKTFNGGDVLLGNNHACKIRGIGTIYIRMFDGVVRKITDVRYVPGMKRNLLSLGVFDSKGYRYGSYNGVLQVSTQNKVLIQGIKENGLYYLQGSTITGHVHVTKEVNHTELWHMRLAHVSDNGLSELSKLKVFGSDRITKMDFCDHCVLGKTHKASFKSGKHTTHGILDYVHSDLWGSARVQNLKRWEKLHEYHR